MLCFTISSPLTVQRLHVDYRLSVPTCPQRNVPTQHISQIHANAAKIPSETKRHVPKRPRPLGRTPTTSAASVAPSTSPPGLVEDLLKLANARGALGRGVKATLRAFHRRTAYIISKPRPDSHIYVEIGPAYVLATSKLASESERPTRYAVEYRAWPALRSLLKWEETTSAEARSRGAVLRRLFEGGRFGRHLFVNYETLYAVIMAAEELIGDTEDVVISSAMELEGTVELKRHPLPGVRTVAVRCPRRSQHSNGDRKPSLMLWMNPDGVTGGALCPVCLDHSTHESPPRNMTWRVHYVSDRVAALYTPRKRIRSPVRVQQAMAEYRRREGMVGANGDKVALGDDVSADSIKSETSGAERKDPLEKRKGAVGGCVMTSKRRIGQVGEVIGMAYVTASLRTTNDVNTTEQGALDCKNATRLRTVGTMAKQSCPMRVLLWSDRRSKGPISSKRVQKVSSFARKSVACREWEGTEGSVSDDIVHSDEWLPTPLLSVSAMKPAGWRDVIGQNGRLVSLPASWEASVQAWILFDVDDIGELQQKGVVTRAANKIILAARRDKELSGRCLVMQTGPCGLHVWAELREVRENPRLWFKKEETRAWYSALGNKLLQATHRGGAKGGKVDMSSCSAGRFARRPGWRLLEDGLSFRSRVVEYAPTAVRNRRPRRY